MAQVLRVQNLHSQISNQEMFYAYPIAAQQPIIRMPHQALVAALQTQETRPLMILLT